MTIEHKFALSCIQIRIDVVICCRDKRVYHGLFHLVCLKLMSITLCENCKKVTFIRREAFLRLNQTTIENVPRRILGLLTNLFIIKMWRYICAT